MVFDLNGFFIVLGAAGAGDREDSDNRVELAFVELAIGAGARSGLITIPSNSRILACSSSNCLPSVETGPAALAMGTGTTADLCGSDAVG